MGLNQLVFGDICRRCGSSVKTHLQNPFGVRLKVEIWSKIRNELVYDYIMCYEFVDDNDVTYSRDNLIKHVTR